MPTCWHHIMYVMFGCRPYRRVVKPCRHADNILRFTLKIEDISRVGSKHSKNPNHRLSQISYFRIQIWGCYNNLPTYGHIDIDSIHHLIFSNKKLGVVKNHDDMPTCRHHIYVMRVYRQNMKGSNHLDMTTCWHAKNIICFIWKSGSISRVGTVVCKIQLRVVCQG